MSFDRFRLLNNQTMAWRLFKRHHTHFNDIFWSHQLARAHVYSSTAPFQRHAPLGNLFKSAIGNRRAPKTIEEWSSHYNHFDLWTRMASVIAITGYLETFIAQIATAALESQPNLIFGSNIPIEGAVYLKHNPKYSFYSNIESLIKGDWNARASAYCKLFTACPFRDSIKHLEKLRKLRNDTGHSFGRDIKSMQFPHSCTVEKLPNIKDKMIQNFLKLAEEVALKIEAQLGKTVVGQYEIIKLYHLSPCKSTLGHLSIKERATAFSQHVAAATGNPYGKEAAIELIKYYESL